MNLPCHVTRGIIAGGVVALGAFAAACGGGGGPSAGDQQAVKDIIGRSNWEELTPTSKSIPSNIIVPPGAQLVASKPPEEGEYGLAATTDLFFVLDDTSVLDALEFYDQAMQDGPWWDLMSCYSMFVDMSFSRVLFNHIDGTVLRVAAFPEGAFELDLDDETNDFTTPGKLVLEVDYVQSDDECVNSDRRAAATIGAYTSTPRATSTRPAPRATNTPRPTSTSQPSPAQDAAIRAAFDAIVDAMVREDWAALYQLQSPRSRQGCSEADFATYIETWFADNHIDPKLVTASQVHITMEGDGSAIVSWTALHGGRLAWSQKLRFVNVDGRWFDDNNGENACVVTPSR